MTTTHGVRKCGVIVNTDKNVETIGVNTQIRVVIITIAFLYLPLFM